MKMTKKFALNSKIAVLVLALILMPSAFADQVKKKLPADLPLSQYLPGGKQIGSTKEDDLLKRICTDNGYDHYESFGKEDHLEIYYVISYVIGI